MTQEEADKVAKIIRTADGGCPVCVGSLCERATAAGLGFRFEETGERVAEPDPEWPDAPEFWSSFPEVIASPVPAVTPAHDTADRPGPAPAP